MLFSIYIREQKRQNEKNNVVETSKKYHKTQSMRLFMKKAVVGTSSSCEIHLLSAIYTYIKNVEH